MGRSKEGAELTMGRSKKGALRIRLQGALETLGPYMPYVPIFRFFLNFERIDLSNYELDWLEIFLEEKVQCHVYISMKKICGAHSSSQTIRKSYVHFFVLIFPKTCMHLPEDREVLDPSVLRTRMGALAGILPPVCMLQGPESFRTILRRTIFYLRSK